MEKFVEFFGQKSVNLQGEGNYYYDVNQCCIEFHGDEEKRRIVCIRLGVAMPIHFQWLYNDLAVGDRMTFEIENGDVYLMSEKAVGADWLEENLFTLTHAIGRK